MKQDNKKILEKVTEHMEQARGSYAQSHTALDYVDRVDCEVKEIIQKSNEL